MYSGALIFKISSFVVLCPQLSGKSYLLGPFVLINPFCAEALISIKSPTRKTWLVPKSINPSLFVLPYVKVVTGFEFIVTTIS